MSANIIRLLPDQEQALLACYVTGSKQPASFQELYDTMEVPTNAEPDRLQIAVAQILLHHVQDGLPQWAAITKDGEFVTNRSRHGRQGRTPAVQSEAALLDQLGDERSWL